MFFVTTHQMNLRVKDEHFLLRLFSVTRRSRSDESHLLTYLLTESWLADLTDVTLVSDDTYKRLYFRSP